MANISENSLPKECLVSGWGKTSKDNAYLSPNLMEVNVSLINNELCSKENVYCSKGEKGPADVGFLFSTLSLYKHRKMLFKLSLNSMFVSSGGLWWSVSL